ncbi:glutathione S-transferase omega-1-like [Branchiostoma floridae]|uniref:Glutathione S-transferase omega n=1 Tax=Branchiostoma floridae TaxID=7739 RepID=A0A9J7LE73_BRAFL|nr:glutathione S-transferase omega-1-like [Branchiostoma floridae]
MFTIRRYRVLGSFSVFCRPCSQTVAAMPTERPMKRGSACPPPPGPGKLRLYSMRFCPYAQRTRLFLAAKGIEHETINIHLKQKPKWFLLEKNPVGKVPVLEKDGEMVFESLVCNEYLDHAYPEHCLTPRDPVEKMRQSMLLSVFDQMVMSHYYSYLRASQAGDYSALSKKFGFGLQHLEKALTQPFFGGSQPGALDYNLWPWFERFSTIPNRSEELSERRVPRLTAWMERMLEQPAVKACHMPYELYSQFVTSFAAGDPDYDAGLGRWSSL